MTRGDLADGEWELVEPFLPIGERGPYPGRLRDCFDGVMWRFRTGSPWRDVPERYGPWQTVYQRFHAWALAGTFRALMEAMIAEAAARGQVELGLVSVDSTVVRAHQDAAGMVVDAELLREVEKAVDEEKGILERGKRGR
ncbi:transposase [Embleya sp. NBC_00896]|uniref:transposase n=1 Tax=Embleya sp. NBC_00896 TaxID=2975961 RepID=UPI003865FD22|nr:transposase [Embleya sp. NBC_00896]